MIKYIKLTAKTKIIIGILSVALLWMLSGLFQSQEKHDTANIKREKPVKSVQSKAELRTKYVTFSANASAKNSVDLITQVTGVVVKKFVNDGARLNTGEKIIQIQNKALLERVQQMTDALHFARIKHNATIELFKKGLSSQLEVDDARKNLNTAEADLAAAEVALNNTYITAPFDGTVDRIFVNVGDVMSNIGAGHNIIGRFVNLDSIEARAYISQKERSSIINSQDATIVNDANQESPAKITFISQSADEKNGTFLVKAVGINTTGISDGEAIKLRIKIGDFASHKVPISAIIIDADGDLSVKIKHKDELKSYKIQVVDEDDLSVFVNGLPESCEIVVAGHSNNT